MAFERHEQLVCAINCKIRMPASAPVHLHNAQFEELYQANFPRWRKTAANQGLGPIFSGAVLLDTQAILLSLFFFCT